MGDARVGKISIAQLFAVGAILLLSIGMLFLAWLQTDHIGSNGGAAPTAPPLASVDDDGDRIVSADLDPSTSAPTRAHRSDVDAANTSSSSVEDSALRPTTGLHGSIALSDGYALEGLRILAYDNPRGDGEELGSAQSLEGGKFMLRLQKEPAKEFVYFWQSSDPVLGQDQRPYPLTAGTPADLVLPGSRLFVSVFDAGGQRVENAMVRARETPVDVAQSDELWAGASRTNGSGIAALSFLRVPVLEVIAEAPDGLSVSSPTTVVMPTAGGSTHIDLVLNVGAPGYVDVYVTNEFGIALDCVAVRLTHKDDPTLSRFAQTTGGAFPFRITAVPAGRYDVSLRQFLGEGETLYDKHSASTQSIDHNGGGSEVYFKVRLTSGIRLMVENQVKWPVVEVELRRADHGEQDWEKLVNLRRSVNGSLVKGPTLSGVGTYRCGGLEPGEYSMRFVDETSGKVLRNEGPFHLRAGVVSEFVVRIE